MVSLDVRFAFVSLDSGSSLALPSPVPARRLGRLDHYIRPRADFTSSSRDGVSHVNSGSGRPKCP